MADEKPGVARCKARRAVMDTDRPTVDLCSFSFLMERCTVDCRAGIAVVVRRAARPTLEACRIASATADGVVFTAGAAGRMHACVVESCKRRGVVLVGRSGLDSCI